MGLQSSFNQVVGTGIAAGVANAKEEERKIAVAKEKEERRQRQQKNDARKDKQLAINEKNAASYEKRTEAYFLSVQSKAALERSILQGYTRNWQIHYNNSGVEQRKAGKNNGK